MISTIVPGMVEPCTQDCLPRGFTSNSSLPVCSPSSMSSRCLGLTSFLHRRPDGYRRPVVMAPWWCARVGSPMSPFLCSSIPSPLGLGSGPVRDLLVCGFMGTGIRFRRVLGHRRFGVGKRPWSLWGSREYVPHGSMWLMAGPAACCTQYTRCVPFLFPCTCTVTVSGAAGHNRWGVVETPLPVKTQGRTADCIFYFFPPRQGDFCVSFNAAQPDLWEFPLKGTRPTVRLHSWLGLW